MFAADLNSEGRAARLQAARQCGDRIAGNGQSPRHREPLEIIVEFDTVDLVAIELFDWEGRDGDRRAN